MEFTTVLLEANSKKATPTSWIGRAEGVHVEMLVKIMHAAFVLIQNISNINVFVGLHYFIITFFGLWVFVGKKDDNWT